MSENRGHPALTLTGLVSNMGIRGESPIEYTTHDLLKRFWGIMALIKFVTHIASLPIVVIFLRKRFGLRYVDDVHLTVSGILWLAASGYAGLVAGMDLVALALALIFIPCALYRRWEARQAALAKERYSYYPGLPHRFWSVIPAAIVGLCFRMLDAVIRQVSGSHRIPYVLRHPQIMINPESTQDLVRRWVEPALVFAVGLVLAITEVSEGLGSFLAVTAMAMYLDETLTQRAQWEFYLDHVDAEVLARERERMMKDDGASGPSLTTGTTLARWIRPEPSRGMGPSGTAARLPAPPAHLV